jgi:hypothetical protein
MLSRQAPRQVSPVARWPSMAGSSHQEVSDAVHPVMLPADLARAGAAIEQAVKKYA